MILFRIFLAVFLVCLSTYTAIVMMDYGPNLFPYFFGDMASFSWAGQFNLDFMGFLMLSAIWVAWRHAYSPAGLGLAVLAFFGGMAFLTVYLLVQSFRLGNDPKALLLGEASR